MTTIIESRRPFIPGMGVDWLLPLYDPLTSLLGLNRAKRELVRQADLRAGHRVLDIGCGTGTLAVLVKQSFPGVEVVGVDPDQKALARAARKARRAGTNIQFDRSFSDALPYEDASFDRVFSSFMLHHLERSEKERTLREVQRVLRPGGTLHLLDFGGPGSTGHRSGARGLLHSHHRLTDNDEDTILRLLKDASFTSETKTRERVVAGSVRIVYYRADKA